MPPLRILLIDDEEDFVQALAERLTLRGFEADGVTTGNDALARMRQKEFDLVVLDLKMPGLSGSDLIAQIRKEHPRVPIIVITGHGAVVDGETIVPAGPWRWLVKPFDIEMLIQAIHESVGSE